MRTLPANQPELPAEFSVTDLPLDLRFGPYPVVLRWLQPGDLYRLIEFFDSHTGETIHQRYGFSLSQMTTERAAALVGVDQERDVALGVFEWWAEAWHLIAVGRYCLFADGRTAELAFVVHEQRRRLGIATTLLRVLTLIARQCGLEHLVAQVQRDNLAMLAVFRRAGATFAPIADANALLATLPVAEAPRPRQRAHRARRRRHGRKQPKNSPRRPKRGTRRAKSHSRLAHLPSSS